MHDSKEYVTPPNDQIIPCFKEKCILLPVCRNKKLIVCNKLIDYISSLSKKGKYDEGWIYLNSIFRELKLLEDENNDNGKYTIMASNKKDLCEVLDESGFFNKVGVR